MVGYSKVYFVGATGGFMGADRLARPFFQIMVGDGSRQWMEVVYDAASQASVAAAEGPLASPLPKRMGKVITIIPAKPDDPVAFLDAVIAFFPAFFRDCPTLSAVEAQLADVEMLDFHMGENVPAQWEQLRKEALPRFRELGLFQADLREVDTSGL
ncbi:MAG: hypothetical protein ABIV11_02885 [Gemmatimonadaceae bacterium]